MGWMEVVTVGGFALSSRDTANSQLTINWKTVSALEKYVSGLLSFSMSNALMLVRVANMRSLIDVPP